MSYTEPELIKTIKRLVSVYLENNPDDQAAVERFLSWVLKQWGYKDGQS